MRARGAGLRPEVLRQKGVLILVPDGVDNRIKYVQPTPMAEHYFAQLGQCLTEAKTTL